MEEVPRMVQSIVGVRLIELQNVRLIDRLIWLRHRNPLPEFSRDQCDCFGHLKGCHRSARDTILNLLRQVSFV
jgi:hypothetical protein